MLKVKKTTLILVAAIVRFLAGANILRIGLQSAITLWQQKNYIPLVIALSFSLLVLIGFLFMFRRVIDKHCRRILSYPEEKKSIFLFFDLKGYLLMAFMMGLGITLRAIDKIPISFFAAFYTGLGTALMLGGIRFFLSRTK